MTEHEEHAIQSEQALNEFIRTRSAYTIDECQPEYRGGTNLIAFIAAEAIL